MMSTAKRKILEEAGFRIGSAADFLGLSEDDRRVVERLVMSADQLAVCRKNEFRFYLFRDVARFARLIQGGWRLKLSPKNPPDPTEDAAVVVDKAGKSALIFVSDRILALEDEPPGTRVLSATAMGAGMDAALAALRQQGL